MTAPLSDVPHRSHRSRYQSHGYGLFLGGMLFERGIHTIGTALFPAGPGRASPPSKVRGTLVLPSKIEDVLAALPGTSRESSRRGRARLSGTSQSELVSPEAPHR